MTTLGLNLISGKTWVFTGGAYSEKDDGIFVKIRSTRAVGNVQKRLEEVLLEKKTKNYNFPKDFANYRDEL